MIALKQVGLWCLLMLAMSASAQTTLLTLKINEITTRDSVNNRLYAVKYQITNNSGRTLRFFLKPDIIRPASTSAMVIYPFYKHFQDDVHIDAATLLPPVHMYKSEAIALLQKKIDSIVATYPNASDANKRWIFSNHQLMTHIMELEPAETKNFEVDLVWDKNRYVRADDHEYYLDADAKHYLELGLILLKEQHAPSLTIEQLDAIKSDPDFISGWLVSNRVSIDFR